MGKFIMGGEAPLGPARLAPKGASRSWPTPLRGAGPAAFRPATPRPPALWNCTLRACGACAGRFLEVLRAKRGKLLGLFFILAGGAALAQTAPGLLESQNPAPQIASRAALLLDAETGTVLYEKNADEPIPPASLTKLMTAHIALREAASGKVSLDERIQPPRESWAINQPPRSSLMFLAAGQQVSLRELLLGMAIASGNDAAVAVALRLAPSVAEFVEMMNLEARNLGFGNTRFTEPSGISEENLTTAREFALFCRNYIFLYPETLGEFHSIPEFAYPKAENVAERYREKPGTIVQYNHNSLLKDFPGTDGLKTGYIDEAGYNIALTARRGGTRFVLVLLGAPAVWGGDKMRDEDGRKLLAWAFDEYRTIRPIITDPEPVRLWKGKQEEARLLIAEEPAFTGPRDRGRQLYLSTELIDPLIAPLTAAERVGTLILSDDRGELRRIPLLAAENYEEGGVFRRLWDSIRLFFRDLSRRAG